MDRFEVAQAVTAAKMLPVMEAWLQGNPVQYNNADSFFSEWKDFEGESPAFDEPRIRWRVKPVPRHWWRAEGSCVIFDSRKEAEDFAASTGATEVIEVVEVLR